MARNSRSGSDARENLRRNDSSSTVATLKAFSHPSSSVENASGIVPILTVSRSSSHSSSAGTCSGSPSGVSVPPPTPLDGASDDDSGDADESRGRHLDDVLLLSKTLTTHSIAESVDQPPAPPATTAQSRSTSRARACSQSSNADSYGDVSDPKKEFGGRVNDYVAPVNLLWALLNDKFKMNIKAKSDKLKVNKH